jgi:hypothetical protein
MLLLQSSNVLPPFTAFNSAILANPQLRVALAHLDPTAIPGLLVAVS